MVIQGGLYCTTPWWWHQCSMLGFIVKAHHMTAVSDVVLISHAQVWLSVLKLTLAAVHLENLSSDLRLEEQKTVVGWINEKYVIKFHSACRTAGGFLPTADHRISRHHVMWAFSRFYPFLAVNTMTTNWCISGLTFSHGLPSSSVWGLWWNSSTSQFHRSLPRWKPGKHMVQRCDEMRSCCLLQMRLHIPALQSCIFFHLTACSFVWGWVYCTVQKEQVTRRCCPMKKSILIQVKVQTETNWIYSVDSCWTKAEVGNDTLKHLPNKKQSYRGLDRQCRQ